MFRPIWHSDAAFAIACGILVISLGLNFLSVLHLRPIEPPGTRPHSYMGDDYPRELPVRLDTVAMTFNDTEHYSISGFWAALEWQSLNYFSTSDGPGLVHLGPHAREFNVSMFHQLECLNVLRLALINGPDAHSAQCLNYIRQAVLCASDITLDALNVNIVGSMKATNGVGSTHICRDWTQVYAYVLENQQGTR